MGVLPRSKMYLPRLLFMRAPGRMEHCFEDSGLSPEFRGLRSL